LEKTSISIVLLQLTCAYFFKEKAARKMLVKLSPDVKGDKNKMTDEKY